MSSMQLVWNKEKNLDKAVWVNQVFLFFQSLCFTIELLTFQANKTNRAALDDIVIV